MILVVFHTAGINEKIYIYIIIMKKKKIGTEPGWATAQVSLRLGWALGWALGAGRAGAGRAGTAQAAWAPGRARARTAGRSRRADTAWTRRGARQAQAGARGAAGWAACARLVCAAGPGWVFCCT